MAIDKITENDFVTYGLDGAEDIPENPRETLQKFEKEVLMPKINDIIDGLAAVNPDAGSIVGAAENGFGTYTHKKTNKQHELTNDEFDYQNIKFIATADFEDGDTFVINRLAKNAKTQDGEPLSGGYFKSGAVVTAFLNGDTLNFKSGGAGLNFKIVGGTTQPASPAENTVWINTDTAVSGWVFSATEPTTQTEGMVWVKTGSISRAAFNLLKSGTVIAYPLQANQYLNAAWIRKSAQSFIDGNWTSWLPIVFDGVWADGSWTELAQTGTASYSLADGYFTLMARAASGAYYGGVYGHTGVAYDLTDVSAIEITMRTDGDKSSSYKLAMMGVSTQASAGTPFSATGNAWKQSMVASIRLEGTETTTERLDVSTLSGLHYLHFAISCYNNTSRYLEVDKIVAV